MLLVRVANISAGLAVFYSPLSLRIFMLTFAGTIAIQQKVNFQWLAEAFLFSSILALVIGTVLWFQSGVRDTSDVGIALNGLAYRLTAYISLYIVS